jgi:DNA polymerase III delta subunit
MAAKKPSTSSPTKSSPARSRAGSGEAPAARAPARRPAVARSQSLTPEALLDRFERGEFPAALYLEGPDEGLKAALLAELRHAWARAVPDAPLARVFRTAEAGVDEVLAAYHGGSLFAPRELLFLFEVEDLGRSEKRVLAFAEGLLRPTSGTCLVLIESEAETARKSLEPLRGACTARCLALPPTRSTLLAWGARRMKREGITLEPGTMEAVVDACEGDATTFFDELEKLSAWAGPGGKLGTNDVAAILRPVVGADLASYLAAVAAGQSRLAGQRLGRLLAAGVSEGQILFALGNMVGGALGGWSRHRDLSQALRSRLAPRLLTRALDALYRAEAAWKGGRADAVAVLEQATRAVAGAA